MPFNAPLDNRAPMDSNSVIIRHIIQFPVDVMLQTDGYIYIAVPSSACFLVNVSRIILPRSVICDITTYTSCEQ